MVEGLSGKDLDNIFPSLM